ncbi:MAG: two-component regulator propeller domain-containing protein [Nitrospinota bacterium]
MLAKSHSIPQPIRWAILILGSLILLTGNAGAFEKPVANKTSGEPYPHIFKKETFTINTRNIKVLKADKNYLWIGTSKGLLRYDTLGMEEIEVYDNTNKLLSNGIFSITIDKNGLPWIGTYGGGLSHFNGKNWRNFNTPNGLNDAFVYDVKFDSEKIWVATWSGINQSTLNSNHSWEAYTVENTKGGLIDNWVYAVEVEPSGRLWFGTESGISTFFKGKWKNFNHTNGLSAPYEKVKGANANIMSMFQGQHHATQASPSIPNIQTADYKPDYIVSMHLDKKNRLWVGTWGGGLSLLDTKNFTFRNFTTEEGLPGNFILSIEEDLSGNLWIGTNNGLSRFDGKVFQNFSRINGLKSKFIFSLEAAKDHSLWIGGQNTLTRLIIDPSTGHPLNLQ